VSTQERPEAPGALAAALFLILSLGCVSRARPDRALREPPTLLPTQPARAVHSRRDLDPGQEKEEKPSFWSRFRDEEDGAFDVGEWLASGKGFLPIAIPLTEPAIGVGLVGVIAYFHRSTDQAGEEGEPATPPSISFAGGAGTDNDTWAAFGGHLGIWNEGRTRYLGAVVVADANLTFYGEGEDLGTDLAWNIQLEGVIQQIKFEVAEHLFVGPQFFYVSTKNRVGIDGTAVDSPELSSNLAGLGLTLSYDDRNTLFTPTSGLYAGAALTFHDEAFGSDFSYSRLNLQLFKYWDVEPFVLGLRVEGSGAGSEAPFYGLPFLKMRGVPAFRYLGRYTALVEVEPTWRITPRWSWLAFLAAGQAVLEPSDFGGDTRVSGGTGFRYLLARRQGLGVGIDVARGPEESALYFTVGSAWAGF
jgi:hypothetical protein